MDFCIDFDGTCVTHLFPKVGKDIGAAPVLREELVSRNLINEPEYVSRNSIIEN